MRRPWGLLITLGVILAVCGSVAIFRIPTLEELGRRRLPKEPLSQEELYRLGALRAVIKYCDIYIEETAKATNLSVRISFNSAQWEALTRIVETFKIPTAQGWPHNSLTPIEGSDFDRNGLCLMFLISGSHRSL